jgi:hypothetical protein
MIVQPTTSMQANNNVTEEVQPTPQDVVPSHQVVCELRTFYCYHYILNRMAPNYFLLTFFIPRKRLNLMSLIYQGQTAFALQEVPHLQATKKQIQQQFLYSLLQNS